MYKINLKTRNNRKYIKIFLKCFFEKKNMIDRETERKHELKYLQPRMEPRPPSLQADSLPCLLNVFHKKLRDFIIESTRPQQILSNT